MTNRNHLISHRSLSLAILVFLGVSNPAFGAQAAPLAELLKEAMQNNLELKHLQAELAAAKGQRRTAGTISNPELGGSLGRKSVQESQTGQTEEGMEYSVSLLQSIEWPGRMSLRKALADGDIALAEMQLRQFEAVLAARLRNQVFNLTSARKRLAAAIEVADRLTALRDVLLHRDPRGPVALLETRIIEAAELVMRRKAGLAEQAERQALHELNQSRGAEADTDFRLREVEAKFRPPDSVEELQLLARKNSWELQSRQAQLSQQKLGLDLAKNERFPALSLGPTYEESALEHERALGLEVSLPLALWNWNGGAVETAEARRAQAEISLSLAERDIARKVRESFNAYSARIRDLSQWRSDAMRHFREAAEMADRRYRLGAVPVGVYVEMQEKYVEAVEALSETQEDALESALALETLTLLATPLAELMVKGEKP